MPGMRAGKTAGWVIKAILAIYNENKIHNSR